MEIIIGRDPQTEKLLLTIDGNESHIIVSNVPAGVGTQHCSLTINKSQMRLNNLDISNYTYVNGQCVESKIITRNDKIELGKEKYLLDWNLFKEVLPSDITHLQPIWEDYERQIMNLQIDERRFNTLRSMTGLITMAAIVLSIATGGKSNWYFILYGIAIVISFIFFIKSYRDASNIPQKRQELNKQLQRKYVCPYCGHFLGNQPYDIIVQNSCCPYCRKQFIH